MQLETVFLKQIVMSSTCKKLKDLILIVPSFVFFVQLLLIVLNSFLLMVLLVVLSSSVKVLFFSGSLIFQNEFATSVMFTSTHNTST